MSTLKPAFNCGHNHSFGEQTNNTGSMQFEDFQCRNCIEAYQLLKFLHEINQLQNLLPLFEGDPCAPL